MPSRITLSTFSPVSHWRWTLALVFFACGLVGFASGVEVSERDIRDAGVLTKAYYSLGLFILGGMDLGVPVGGPLWGRTLLWVGYFGAPALTGSAIVDWVHQIISHEERQLRAIRNHIVIIGTGDLVHILLAKVVQLNPSSPVVVADRVVSPLLAQELASQYNALVVEGDFTSDFFLSRIRIKRARRVIIVGENDFENFETASKILDIRPALADRVLVHCNRLRFLRGMATSQVAQDCITFNSYHLAATELVRTRMMAHFRETAYRDTVVLAGFGRFGQTILEELHKVALEEISRVAIIDIDAERRILVTREQFDISDDIEVHVLEGEIGHPEVWRKLSEKVDLLESRPLVLLATGMDDENLRTGLWLKNSYPNAVTMVRSAKPSHFSSKLAEDSGLDAFGISEIINDAMPDSWFD